MRPREPERMCKCVRCDTDCNTATAGGRWRRGVAVGGGQGSGRRGRGGRCRRRRARARAPLPQPVLVRMALVDVDHRFNHCKGVVRALHLVEQPHDGIEVEVAPRGRRLNGGRARVDAGRNRGVEVGDVREEARHCFFELLSARGPIASTQLPVLALPVLRRKLDAKGAYRYRYSTVLEAWFR